MSAGRASRQRHRALVYFDFDSFTVKDEYRSVIETACQVAGRANARKRVMIEGHTDERGGREYNLALGPEACRSGARALTLLGVSRATSSKR